MTPNYKKLELVFRDSEWNRRKSVFFDIETHSLAQKWARLLEGLLENKPKLDKDFLLVGWLSGTRNLDFLCRNLNSHIQKINEFFRDKSPTYFIDQNFDQKNVTRDHLNLIHHHFEVLIGQVWNPSPYYIEASRPIRYSICQLNHLCHEIEGYIKALAARKKEKCHACVITGLTPMVRHDLADEDYNFFNTRMRFGEVRLHYSQLGKTHLEAFFDNDNVIGDNNISGLRYVTGEFDISFTDAAQDRYYEADEKRFRQWLVDNQFDPDDKKLALGYARVATLNLDQFSRLSNLQILDQLFKYDDISQIAVHSDVKVTGANFPLPEYLEIHHKPWPQKLAHSVTKRLSSIDA